MSFRNVLWALALTVPGWSDLLAESLTVELTANRPVEAALDSKVDDNNFADPRAYRQHGAAAHVFQRRLTLTNTGTMPLTGPLLIINGRDWTQAESLRENLNPTAPASQWMPRLFRFWCNHISHADSDAPGGKEPLALLNFWGYALCGDTTAALTHVATSHGVPARKIPLNGHVAAEYFYDNAWHIFDADQNVVYLGLDNRTLASVADVHADPFLARRTKVFGRYAPMDVNVSAFNTSLHEFIHPKDDKPVSHKKPPMGVRAETLYQGESMIIYCDQAPERAVGRTDLKQWGSVREDALSLVEFTINPKERQTAPAGDVVFTSGYPIISAVNHTTGEVVATAPGDPTFEIKVKVHSPDDRVSVYAQRARALLPMVQKGRNTFRLGATDAKGKATLVVDWQPAPADFVVPVATAVLADAAPTFTVQYPEGADHLWWQIAADASFDFVAPNLDSIAPPLGKIVLDPLTATFLNPGQPYYFRAKVRRADVWGDWSAPLSFQVEKPARPAPAKASVIGNRLRLTWPDAGEGSEYLVFGSNRLDFLPEPLAADEIVILRNQGVEQSRPNKNLVSTVTKPETELDATCRYYRVLTRRAGTLSVPGDLIVTPSALATKLPPGLVLQDRWQRAADPKHPGSETDEHLATETTLP